MNCWKAQRRSADFVDGRLRPAERNRVAAHLAECSECFAAFEQARHVKSSLQALPAPAVPADLRSALRIAASRERQAVVDALGSPLRRAIERWFFRLDQLMRPFTVPATGGVLSTLLLFSAVTFTIGARTPGVGYDVPVFYADRLDANLVPMQLRSSVILTLSLDGKGHITDYAVRDSSAGFVGDASRLQFKNISLPDFPSVLAAAQPVNRDISIRFVPIVFRP